MPAALQERAKAFLKRPVPAGIDYVPGSMAELFIAAYAKRGKAAPDAESREMMELCAMEAEAAAAARRGEPAAYFRETAAILRAMLGEV